jgi:hypothetical protein
MHLTSTLNDVAWALEQCSYAVSPQVKEVLEHERKRLLEASKIIAVTGKDIELSRLYAQVQQGIPRPDPRPDSGDYRF